MKNLHVETLRLIFKVNKHKTKFGRLSPRAFEAALKSLSRYALIEICVEAYKK